MKNVLSSLKHIRLEHPMDVLDTMVFYPHIRRTLKCALYLVVTVFLAKEAAATFWLVTVPPTVEGATHLISPPSAVLNQRPLVSVPVSTYEDLRTSLLFGRSADLANDGIASEAATVATTLNVALTGTIIDADPRAFIWDNTANKTTMVREGDRFLPSVTVEKIGRRHVVVNNGGKTEELTMLAANLTPHGKDGKLMPSVTKLAYEQDATKKQTISITRADALTALGNPGELIGQAKFIKRVNHEGAHEGFTLMDVQHNSFISQLGLRDGDVLLKLDGIPLVQRERILPMMFALQNAAGAELTLIRGGEVLALDVTIQD